MEMFNSSVNDAVRELGKVESLGLFSWIAYRVRRTRQIHERLPVSWRHAWSLSTMPVMTHTLEVSYKSGFNKFLAMYQLLCTGVLR